MSQPHYIKYYLKSKSPESLKMMMIQNNIKHGAYHRYDIIFADGFWYAWYEQDAENLFKEQVGKLGTNK